MVAPCHTFIKAGRSNNAPGLMHRLFSVCRRIINPKTTSHTHPQRPVEKESRWQFTNAEFHLTKGEIERLIDGAANMRDRAITSLLAETGIRRAELCYLSIDDIRWHEKQIIIRKGKGSKTRLVPMTSELAETLKALTANRQIGPLFVSRNGGPLSARQVNRIVAEAGVRANINNPNPKYRHVTPHLLRHSFARWWKDRGGNIEALSSVMGHASVSTTWNVYGKMSLHDIGKHYNRIMGERKAKK